MHTYPMMLSRVLSCLSLVTLTGCFSAGAKPPGANAPCSTNDSCPTGYKCYQATLVASGKFCCKDSTACGPVASGGTSAGGGSAKGGQSGDAASSSGGRIVADGSLYDGGAGGGTDSGGSGGGSGGSPDAAPDASTPPSQDAPVLLSAGALCSVNSDCALNNCVDGVCCATACAGCNACKSTQTGVSDGTCAPVSLGLDPHNTCTDETASKPCGNDGTCDGKGACHKVSNGKVCAAATCSGTTFTPVATCDGAGICTAGTPQDCGLFQCALTGCLKACTTDTDCGTTNYCSAAGTCAAKLANGATATAGSQCTSGVVADGVCCDKACAGCLACTSALNGQAASTTGQCLQVMLGKAGHGTCTAAPPCGLDGMCDGNGACHYTPAATSCAPDSCSGSTLMTSACDGVAHTCVASSNACKGALVCASASACKTTCTADSDCVTGDYCASGVCTAKLDNGAKCGGQNQCKNGNCVEGVCCDGACGQICRSCLGSKTGGQDGTCANMTPGSACTGGVCNSTTSTTPACQACVQNNSCPPTNACKTGKLDCSTGTAVCKEDQNLDATHACGPAASCNTTTNKATRAQMCDGQGNCPVAIVDACAYGCNGTVCATAKPQGTACGSTAECATGLSCADGYCCNSTCTGSCQACNVASALGTCTTLVSGSTPHSGHTPCVTSDATCAGYCNGTSASCAYPSTTCGTSTCTGQSYQATGTCSGGVCAKPNPQTCNNSCLAGTGCVACTPTAKQCSSSGVPQVCSSSGTWQNGTSCSGCATCSAGACVPSAGSCPAADVCHAAGTCNTSTGSCTAGAPVTGPCNDNDACTVNDSCQSGTCKGSPKPCSAVACQTNTGCSNGTCLTTPAQDGTSDPLCLNSNYPVCVGGSCQQCYSSSNCKGNLPNCNTATHTCVECVSDANCAAKTTKSCDTTKNQCVCRRPSAGNLLKNPGFDTDLSNWVTSPDQVSWYGNDADGCMNSGEAYSTYSMQEPAQCVSASPGVIYWLGATFNFSYLYDGSYCEVDFYNVSGCNQGYYSIGSAQIGPNGGNTDFPLNGWRSYSTSVTAPPGTVSAYVFCNLDENNDGNGVDQIYLNKTNSF